jgi:predicted permease
MRLYRALLRLYPPSFREEYRDELCRAFEERTREYSGPARVLAAFADVVPNALAEHVEILRQDLGYAFRSLRSAPGLAITAILVVALGVGANTAVFSIADLVFVRPLPYAEPDRLVKIWQGVPGGFNEASPANYRDWKSMSTSFSSMGVLVRSPANLVGGDEPRRMETVRATPEVLPVTGVAPLLGRTFTAEDVQGGSFAVLSYGTWQSLFGGDRRVLGTTVRLDGVPHTVVGVMPASFQFPTRTVEAWTSLVLQDEDFEERDNTYLEVIARLKTGVTVRKAQEELTTISANLERQFPKENYEVRATIFSFRDELSRRSRMLVVALCGAALCILLLACANLASLFLARDAHRARELAMRVALGAGPDRLVRQLVTETLTIAVIGGAVGVAAAAAGVPLLAQLIPDGLPVDVKPSLDLRALALAGGFILFTGLAIGLAPAVRAGGSNALGALRGGMRAASARTQHLRAALVIVEVAASVVLVITTGLLIRAIWKIQATDPGFVAENVLTMKTALPLPKYLMTDRRVRYYDRVLGEVRALPGVRDAAFATGLPMAMRGGIWGVTIAGQDPDPDARNSVSLRYVTPRFFATLGIPMKRGRDIAPNDTRSQPFVAVVSQSFADQHWPNQDPIGKRFNVAVEDRMVVGVVGDVRVRGLEGASEPQVYLSYQQVRDSSIIGYTPKDLVVRTEPPLERGALLPKIRDIVRSADPEQPISNVRPLPEILVQETAPRLTQLRLLGAFSLIALLIAGLGIHGLLSFTVSKRSQELGVRMALGAQVAGIVGLVLREGLMLALIGMAIGVAVAYAGAHAMGALLVGVRPEDPLTLVTATLLCLVTATFGCLLPALRAARVDPLAALRAE